MKKYLALLLIITAVSGCTAKETTAYPDSFDSRSGAVISETADLSVFPPFYYDAEPLASCEGGNSRNIVYDHTVPDDVIKSYQTKLADYGFVNNTKKIGKYTYAWQSTPMDASGDRNLHYLTWSIKEQGMSYIAIFPFGCQPNIPQ